VLPRVLNGPSGLRRRSVPLIVAVLVLTLKRIDRLKALWDVVMLYLCLSFKLEGEIGVGNILYVVVLVACLVEGILDVWARADEGLTNIIYEVVLSL
jgi:hypothetical protein